MHGLACADPTPTGFTLRWAAPWTGATVTGYEVWLPDTDARWSVGAEPRAVVLDGLGDGGATHTCRVRAVNGARVGPYSDAIVCSRALA